MKRRPYGRRLFPYSQRSRVSIHLGTPIGSDPRKDVTIPLLDPAHGLVEETLLDLRRREQHRQTQRVCHIVATDDQPMLFVRRILHEEQGDTIGKAQPVNSRRIGRARLEVLCKYKGKHEPIITKELFDLVQQQVKSQVIRVEDKEFAFTKLMQCGLCSSGVCADEKFKNLKDGSVSKYIYYGCTRSQNIDCKEGYIEEKVLINQLTNIIDQIDLDQSGIKKKLEAEIERHKKFHSRIMGKANDNYSAKDADIRNYAKYLLTEGSLFEKRDLLTCLKSRVVLKNKRVYL